METPSASLAGLSGLTSYKAAQKGGRYSEISCPIYFRTWLKCTVFFPEDAIKKGTSILKISPHILAL
jgi:hypothetical protein